MLSHEARAVGECPWRTTKLEWGYCHCSCCEWWINGYLGMVFGGRKHLVLQNGGDVSRCRNGVGMLEDGGGNNCYDGEVVWGVATSDAAAWLYWYWSSVWRVRSLLAIGMVHRNIRNGSKVADTVYIKTGCLVLEDFLLFSLYFISCMVKQTRLWRRLESCADLTFSIRTFSRLAAITTLYPCYRYHLRPTPHVAIMVIRTPGNTCAHSHGSECFRSSYLFMHRNLDNFATSNGPHQELGLQTWNAHRADKKYALIPSLKSPAYAFLTPSWC